MLSERGAPFLRRWHDEYRTFRSKGRDRYWAEHAVELPMRLSQEFPNEVTVLPETAFFWPGWQGAEMRLLYRSLEPLVGHNAYANHLHETGAWEPFLADLTVRQVRKVDTPFH